MQEIVLPKARHIDLFDQPESRFLDLRDHDVLGRTDMGRRCPGFRQLQDIETAIGLQGTPKMFIVMGNSK